MKHKLLNLVENPVETYRVTLYSLQHILHSFLLLLYVCLFFCHILLLLELLLFGNSALKKCFNFCIKYQCWIFIFIFLVLFFHWQILVKAEVFKVMIY